MNRIAKILAFGAVNIIIGYAIYPIINTDVLNDESNKTQTLTTLTSDKKSTSTIRLTTSPKKAVESIVLNTQNSTVLETQTIENEAIETKNNKITKNTNNHTNDDPDYVALNDWAQLHKEKLFETITANVPDALADAMKNVISENNNFLNNPELLQDTHKDENWAYITEQNLRNLIIQNPLSINFNLLKLTCKQLTCEVFGTETEKGTWRKIYWSLLQVMPALKKPNSSNERNSISFSDEGISYIYFKLKFSEEVDSY
jgi:RecG-like helicase